jgi:starch synthase
MPSRRPSSASKLNVMMIASEVAPWAKTGGLADVMAGLPAALDAQGHHVTVVLPLYRGIHIEPVASVARRVSVGAATHAVVLRSVNLPQTRRVVFVDCPPMFDRDAIYGHKDIDFPDNDERFALLSAAALEFAEHDLAEHVDIVHAHDWQAGLAPLSLRVQPARWPRVAGAGLVFTIHNLAYQGLFPAGSVPALGLDWSVFTVDGAEFWGQLSFLKAGINYADIVTTVSPSYARETRTSAHGAGFDGVLRSRGDRYVGILNGIDTTTWTPASDPFLPAPFSAKDLSGKRVCKRALLERFKLPVGDDAMARPLIGMVSRLVDQKGVDLVVDAADALFGLDAAWVFVGTGEARYETALRDIAAKYPSRVGVFIGFDERLAHLVEAGADMFLMPSRFEPCGLNQMYSLRYGTIPIVHAVGGLDDTIQPYTARARRANGFKFREPTPPALARSVGQAVRLFDDADVWKRLMRQGMAEDHSWENSAREYVKVYRKARQEAAARRAGLP